MHLCLQDASVCYHGDLTNSLLCDLPSADHMFIPPVKLKGSAPSQGTTRETLRKRFVQAFIAKSDHSKGFVINTRMLTIGDYVLPLCNHSFCEGWDAPQQNCDTLSASHTFLITLQIACYFCCRKFLSRLKSRDRLEAELCLADFGCCKQLTWVFKKNICVAVGLLQFTCNVDGNASSSGWFEIYADGKTCRFMLLLGPMWLWDAET